MVVLALIARVLIAGLFQILIARAQDPLVIELIKSIAAHRLSAAQSARHRLFRIRIRQRILFIRRHASGDVIRQNQQVTRIRSQGNA